MTAIPQSEAPSRTAAPGYRRAIFLRWLRKTHGWIGLWGAGLGLLFGGTGILLNHRAVLKIPAVQAQESTVQVALPEARPANVKAMAAWLQAQLSLDQPASRMKEEPERPAIWGDKAITQPAHWTASFASPAWNVQADWCVGNDFVTVKRADNNLFGTLTNLHKGVGAGIGWVLLVDTLAGSIILLSLTGVVLWTQLNRRRLVGTIILLVSLGVTITLAMKSI